LCGFAKRDAVIGVHVVVVGCGRVGSELAVALERDSHSVAVVDKNRNAFRRLPERFMGRQVLGFGFDRDHLEQAGIREAEALAAVTSGDNSNILTARIARETFEIPNVVARIYDPRRAVIYQRLGIPTVATVAWTTDQVLRRLIPQKAVTEWTDATGTMNMIERALPPAWAGRKLSELDEADQFRVVVLTRGGTSRMADPTLVGQEGDVLHLVVHRDAVSELEARLGDSAAASH
jgi:trk system potassium uptake protein TrkA